MYPILRFLLKAMRQKRTGWKTPVQIRQIQQQRLRHLVAHARARSPYYAEKLQGVDPAHFQLEELPTLTKAELMAHFDEILTNRTLQRSDLEEFIADPSRLGQWYRGQYAITRTSGTQGQAALVVQDRSMMELLFALQMTRGTAFPTRLRNVVQRLFHPARLAVVTIGRGFYPSAVGLAYAPEAARRFVNRLWLTTIDPLADVVTRLNEFQPNVLLAYANVLELLAREALAGRLRLGRETPLRQVINMSEPLSAGAAQLIGKAFGLQVTNNYAAGECMTLSMGCLQGHGMHLQADWAILEVVDRANRPVPVGQPGEKVLVTNLSNTLQPFIRYEIPDVVTLSPTPCPCGSPFPLIRSVEGRSDDIVWIRDGDSFRQIHPYVFVDVLDECPEVGWYQIIQRERNSFRLRAGAAPGRSVSREELQAVVRAGLARFGLNQLIRLEVELTGDIAPDPKSGKLKRIWSQVGRPDQQPAQEIHAAGAATREQPMEIAG